MKTHTPKKRRKPKLPKIISKQYRWQLGKRALGLCPICGERMARGSRSYCPRHLAIQRKRMNRHLPIMYCGIHREDWVTMDWSLGFDAVAQMTGKKVSTARVVFCKLLIRGEAKVEDCPDKLTRAERRMVEGKT